MRREDPVCANLQMRVGVNTGDVVAGNIGSQTRMDYTVIGDNVNVASRIEGACRPDCVMVSATTWERVSREFPGGMPAQIRVKNREEPVSTFLIDPAVGAPA
jgi:adenylate cyclase